MIRRILTLCLLSLFCIQVLSETTSYDDTVGLQIGNRFISGSIILKGGDETIRIDEYTSIDSLTINSEGITLIPYTTEATFTRISVTPNDQLVMKDTTFNISIYCIPSEPIKSYELEIRFDQTKIIFNNVTEGDIFSDYPTFFSPSIEIDNENGSILKIYSLIIGQGNVTEPGYLVTLSGTALSVTNGIPMVELIEVGVTNETQYLSNIAINGRVEVRGTNRYDIDGSGDVSVSDLSILWDSRNDYSLLYDVDSSGDISVSDLSWIWSNH